MSKPFFKKQKLSQTGPQRRNEISPKFPPFLITHIGCTIQRLHIWSIVNKFEPSKKICPSVKSWTTLFDCKKTFHSSEKMHPSVKSWTIFFSEADTRFQILESGVSVPLLPCTTPKKAHRRIFPTQLYIDST